MKLIYTHENRLFVANAKNILESHAIDVVLKNEFVSSAIGEVSPFDAWLELWITEDADYDRAKAVLESAISEKDAPAWHCCQCGEDNDASFEWCWNCGNEQAQSHPADPTY